MVRKILPILVIALGGCMFGPSYDDVSARTGAGARIEVRRHEGGDLTGEFVGLVAEGPVLRTAGAAAGFLLLVPFENVRELRVRGVPTVRSPQRPEDLGDMRRVARYPQGIDDTLLASLLQAYGQTELERAPR